MSPIGIDAYMRNLDSLLAAYIPPTETWTPADEALYGPRDPFRVPADDARGLLFRAVKYAFEHHYTKSKFYRRFCDENGVGPGDIRDASDFAKIPLVSHDFFKGYPSDGKGFASWLGNIYTDEALNLAQLHPLLKSNTLDEHQSRRLWSSIRQVLLEGIERQGASIDWVYKGGDFQNYFRVYQRTGEPCPECGQPVLRITVGQRGTHYCQNCQPEPS